MKKVFRIHRTRGEEGMALLFALGFLALLLILGLGFVTTSLLSQKIAANNSSRAQARMFARSAAARAMLDVMLYNDDALLKGVKVENYDSIRSYDQVDYNRVGTEEPGPLNDQLHVESVDADGNPAIPGKLNYRRYGRDLMGKDVKANWIYFYDSPKDTPGRRIIGRVAFQTLPRQEGRLSLYAVTGGSKIENDYVAYPHSFRWGRDIAELDLTNTTALPNWYANTALTAGTVPFKYRSLYNSFHSFFPNSDPQETKNHKKRWIEYWFSEGRNTILGEAFPVLESGRTVYYNRFNISDRYYKSADRNASGKDNWYDRFLKRSGGTEGWTSVTDDKKNSDAAVEALAGEAIAHNDAQTEDAELDPSGLPFLKRIGNDKWSFDDLKYLRKQIAANFNDYCDADSIPTSDVKAASWSVTAADDALPKYTGNERTLYINEVGVQIGRIGVHYNSADRGIGIKDDIDIKALVELINMYDNSDADKSGLLDPANLKVKFNLKELSFKIALYAKYTGRITYTGSDNKTKTVTVNDSNAIEVNKNYSDDKFRAEVKCTEAAVDISGTGNAEGKFSTLANGYSVGKATVTAAVTNPQGSDFSDAIMVRARELADADASNRGITVLGNVKFAVRDVVAGYEIKLEDSKIWLSPMMLATNKSVTVDGSEVPADTGLDFVRFDRVGAMTLSGSDLERETGMRVSSADARKNKTYFIGGIEAKDPRQNLNPRSSGNSDWKIAPKFRPAAAVAADESGLPSMILSTFSTAGYDYEVDISKACGKLNSDANPSGRETGGAGDKETATDPAWLGTGQADGDHPTAQHVSTAYIRNAPMVSPWEIGLIHRGREWQTLKLTRAGGFGDTENIRIVLEDIKSKYADDWSGDGTKYENGDGAILEFIKVGTGCRCMGKIPLDQLRTGVIASGNADWNGVDAAYNKDIVKMLFHGIRAGQTMKQFYAETKFNGAVVHGGEAIDTSDASFNGAPEDLINEVDNFTPSANGELKMRSQFLNSEYGDKNGKFTFGMADKNNDAGREEIIGKTINLLTVGATAPNVFRVIVVAQAINDVGGVDSEVTMTKIHKNSSDTKGRPVEQGCKIGRFDFIRDQGTPPQWEYNTYFDEITGEVKALVTIERIPATNYLGDKNEDFGRLVVTEIEFVE